jgi:hypothetical protein
MLAKASRNLTSNSLPRPTLEVYVPEHFFDDQIIEIPCTHCHATSPKTIAWVRANDRYNCPGCNALIILDRGKLLAAVLSENRGLPHR